MLNLAPCPTHDTLLQFLDGRLVPDEAESVESHLATCSSCAGVLPQLETNRQAAPAGDTPLEGFNVGELVARFKAIQPSAGLYSGEWADELENLPATIGPYHVEGEIAVSGMGRIVRVRDRHFNRPLAMKLPKIRHPHVEARLQREARITGVLQHPGIPPVHDLGSLNDGRPYFVMKLIEGRSLHDLLAQRESPASDLPRFVGIFGQICQTVGYAHSRGVIHRDLKPENTMVGAFGEVQVIDWGLAKELKGTPADEAAAAGLAAAPGAEHCTGRTGGTIAGDVMGTPAFMTPEQARGEVDQVDARSDVFGLGAILCVILTGDAPYSGPDIKDIHGQAMRGDLSKSRARLDGCGADRELIDLAKRCLAAGKKDRPADGDAVAWAIQQYQELVGQRERKTELEQEIARRPQKKWGGWLVWTGLFVVAAASIYLGLFHTDQITRNLMGTLPQPRHFHMPPNVPAGAEHLRREKSQELEWHEFRPKNADFAVQFPVNPVTYEEKRGTKVAQCWSGQTTGLGFTLMYYDLSQPFPNRIAEGLYLQGYQQNETRNDMVVRQGKEGESSNCPFREFVAIRPTRKDRFRVFLAGKTVVVLCAASESAEKDLESKEATKFLESFRTFAPFANARKEGGEAPVETEDAIKELDRLQGVWVAETQRRFGENVPKDKMYDLQFEFSGNTLQMKTRSGVISTDKVKLNPSANPKQIDLATSLGLGTRQGIYEFTEDGLTICYTLNVRGMRPVTFDADEGTEFIRIAFKKKGNRSTK